MTTQIQKAPEPTAVPAGAPRPAREKIKSEGAVLNIFSHGFLILWAAMVVVPLAWAIMTSFKTTAEITSTPWSLPTALHWENWTGAWTTANFGSYFLHSIIVVGGGVIGTMLFGAMAAYVLARFEFPGNRAVYYLFVSGMTFPVFLALVPLFFVLKNMGLLATYQGLILVYIGYSLPFTVFFLTSFFRTLPTSIAEAALIDGAGHTRTFFSIMLPLARPGLISIGIFNVLGQWNQYLLPLVLNPDTSKFVLTQGLADLAVNQGYAGDYGRLFAGLSIAMLPMLIMYVIFQRQIQAGMTAGAVK
jgi:N-acetylglucosamine transport system permease protein